ncbi:Cytochrome c-type biogenesis protein CcmE, heme chaperone [hydrothermal vent metagenome]|uniref:Cytochrome c-type biogenesis protein CcmE, heme chaperone n=1 Tax=hydrothermal vent metagenome TaxID=652676 RepID=A0A3B0U1I4_9ZZZZ
MTRKQKRLSIIFGLAIVVALAVTLILSALREQIVFFYSPSELLARPNMVGKAVRIGGLVEDGSWVKNGLLSTFSITDGEKQINVTFDNLLPDLFREGQGVIAEGKLAANGSFVATTVLAKHDENYVPREITATFKDPSALPGNK